MAVKTFTTGETLTTSDTNTYLANSGLVYIKSQTIGTAVTAVTVSDAFSSTYDNYQIITSGGAASTSAQFFLTLGATATGYYSAGAYCTYAGAVSASAQSNAAYFMCSSVDSQSLALNVTLQNPFTAFKTLFVSNYFGLQTGDGGLVKTGFLNNTTSYTSFTLTLGAGTMTGGTITVYGYRKA